MTRICVPIMASTAGQMAREIDDAQAAGAQMIELRLDYLQDRNEEGIRALMEYAACFPGQIIVTCRLASEGGQYNGSEDARMELMTAAIGPATDFIDVEYEAWRHSPLVSEQIGLQCAGGCESRNPQLRLILSKHDFQHTPADLDAIFNKLLHSHADVVKLACKAESITDSLRMLEALRNARRSPLNKGGLRGVIALSMGETGILTRVLARKFGALLTFAALDTGKESAPGQPTIKDLRELYRWDALNPATRVYGVVGCPVAHSMSPAIHNAAFAAVGHDGVYLPMRVEPSFEAFEAFLDGCLARPWLDLRGLSVTIPHKENLLRYAEARGGEIDPLTRRIGVANTLHIEPGQREDGSDAKLYAFNTDYRGALDALCQGMGCQPTDLAGMPVAVLGAGGVSRAIVAGLTDCGCRVTIYNRTAEKAVALAAEFGAKALPWEQRVRPGTQVIINCTSIGMWPHTADTPLGETGTSPAATTGGAGILPASGQLTVFDTVYNPIESRLLREAREQGHQTIDGVAMFVGQAAAQFERWTGQTAPTDLMRDIVVRRLTATR
ncbi:MAG TPA: type I 3-dehydroquinate dehydratase [Phycisphaerae bacterium]|jgi:3-dehydroquinate dehydratase/shikimate dehydrogenase|nr:type I 3-dehydroquinate dehydratase [Phycisphaerae bacterium]HOJ54681.1 type I 3-dehydroquinate dehydratase [Phycisphaerae bacterium]HOL25969.1 type I 3-dehydroquinate dehydratase [Phycisphaerae bacterium]HPP19459.1 type I 3-dehydroquinate dehydratase [Phycisphaerae bacterium]HPU33957.1 type I 3-dehydroquinate dehydratase [Phycisphaerae bacterium]